MRSCSSLPLRILQPVLLLALCSSAFLQGDAFHITFRPKHASLNTLAFPSAIISQALKAESSDSSSTAGGGDSDDDDDQQQQPHNTTSTTGLVTKEIFLRDLLELPSPSVSVQKKQKKGRGGKKEYRVLDNRDSLPFAVQVTTPDPYTHPDVKEKRAKLNRVKKRNDAVEQIASSLYTQNGKNDSKEGSDQDFSTKLGEFVLDKHTTTGDLLNIGDKQFKVVRHKCQYKYAGGQRFVMVRKVLQVKEVGRLQTEEYLQRQWKGTNEEDEE